MKFSCGETYDNWKARLESWHRWFAWRPVHIYHVDGRWVCAWLEYVERKGELRQYGWNTDWHWEYRSIKK